MTCREIEDLILESLETAPAADPAVAPHVAECASCRAFLELQMSLDVALATRFAAPELTAAFDDALRSRIAADRRRALWEAAPDLLQVGGGLAGSGICALLLPEAAGWVIVFGTGITLTAYLIQMMVRSWLEQAD